MEATACNGVSRDLGQGSTRRGFLRLLGGATATGGVAARGLHEPAAAKRRGNRKKQCRQVCHSEEKCVNGKCVPLYTIICYQGQTLRVSPRGWQNRFPGATSGACMV